MYGQSLLTCQPLIVSQAAGWCTAHRRCLPLSMNSNSYNVLMMMMRASFLCAVLILEAPTETAFSGQVGRTTAHCAPLIFPPHQMMSTNNKG